jgi:hypothetical protein
MAFTKKTLRKMTSTPETRKVAEALNDIERGTRKLKRLLPVIQEMEFQSHALKEGQHPKGGDPPTASMEIGIKPDNGHKTPDVRAAVAPVGWEDLGGGQ